MYLTHFVIVVRENKLCKQSLSTQASFNITNAISGSATSYTVTYTDSVTAADCGTETVLASSCQDGDGTCTHFFDVSTSMCDRSARLNVAVSATNVLGEGQPSSQVLAPGK